MKFSTNYHVNESERTVTAVLTVYDNNDMRKYVGQTTTSALYSTLKKAGAISSDSEHINIGINYLKALIPDTYVGVARCREGDVFDVEFGKRLARAIAFKKYNKKRIDVILQMRNEIAKESIRLMTALRTVAADEQAALDEFTEKFNFEFCGEFLR